MPIYRLLRAEAFEPETAEMLGRCFDAILIDLNLAKRDDPATLSIAQKMIEMAKWGERDPARLRQRVLETFKP